MDAARLYPCLGAPILPTTGPPSPCEGCGCLVEREATAPVWIGVVPQQSQWDACRRSGWQHRSQETSSLLILIACDGREIYGSKLRFVRGSNSPY